MIPKAVIIIGRRMAEPLLFYESILEESVVILP